MAYPPVGPSLGAEWGARGSARRPMRRAATVAVAERQTVGATEPRRPAQLVHPESAVMRGRAAGAQTFSSSRPIRSSGPPKNQVG